MSKTSDCCRYRIANSFYEFARKAAHNELYRCYVLCHTLLNSGGSHANGSASVHIKCTHDLFRFFCRQKAFRFQERLRTRTTFTNPNSIILNDRHLFMVLHKYLCALLLLSICLIPKNCVSLFAYCYALWQFMLFVFVVYFICNINK